MSLRDPQDRFFRYTTLTMLILAVLVSTSASVLHRLEPDPHPLDLVVPPAAALILSGLTLSLFFRPHWIHSVIRLTLFTIIGALAIPAWFYTSEAYHYADIRLVDTFPPISSILLLV